MSNVKVTASADTPIPDLGITVATGSLVLSDQFEIADLIASLDLEALVQAGTLTIELDYGVGYTAIAAANYSNRDVLGSYLNIYEITNENTNEKLVNNSDADGLHHHDTRYFTKTQLGAVTDGASGASLIGIDQTPPFDNFTPAQPNVQSALEAIDDAFDTIDLDRVYQNDADKIMNVNDGDLDLRSNNTYKLLLSRILGADYQKFLEANPTSNELILGSDVVGALAALNVRIKKDLIVEGNIQYTGTITDTQVTNLDVSNNAISLNEGQAIDVDGFFRSNRPVAGNDAQLQWDEAADRWKHGIVGTMYQTASHEFNEQVSGLWNFIGPASTAPNLLFTDKAAAPTTNLGAAGQIPLAVINNELAILDKSFVTPKFLSVMRMDMAFTGRDSALHINEYLRYVGAFTSNQSSGRLEKDMTLVGITVQTNGFSSNWNVRVRKNGSATNIHTEAVTTAGHQTTNLNVDFNAGDRPEIFLDGTGINRPIVRLIFATRYP